MFEPDDRFRLVQLLTDLADPAGCSHPQWDARLEMPGETKPADWIDGHEPTQSRRDLDPSRFAFFKRAFYFEHACGTEAFALEPEHAARFAEKLAEAAQGDSLLVRELIEAINLCYCPIPFRGVNERLCLWIGHRYHEQPTRSYVANQFIPASDFEIVVPRLPRRMCDTKGRAALDYQPDHFLLRHRGAGERGLRVDFSLFATLSDLRAGLPRHLMPDRNVNRLDAFLEQLQSSSRPQDREFIAFNTQHRLVNRIRLSADWKRYVEVKANE